MFWHSWTPITTINQQRVGSATSGYRVEPVDLLAVSRFLCCIQSSRLRADGSATSGAGMRPPAGPVLAAPKDDALQYSQAVTRRHETAEPNPRKSSHAQDEVNDRKHAIRLTKWGVVLSALGVVAALIAAAAAVIAILPSSKQALPGELLIVKPDVGVGGSAILAAPILASKPVDYLRGGTQLRVDCYKNLAGKYGLAHIVGEFEQNRWIDVTTLMQPNGEQADLVLAKLGSCKE
jgi:hypothetical protein